MNDAVAHSERAHSSIGPSSATRVIGCPGSVKLIEQHGKERPPGAAALLGTEAHELMERALLAGDAIIGDSVAHRSAAFFVDAVKQELAVDPADAVLLVERKIDLARFHPALFGTVDCGIWYPRLRKVTVLDLKSGVMPVAADSPQLLLYAAMLLETLRPRADDVLTVECIVVQPNAPGQAVKRKTYKTAEVVRFFSDYVDLAWAATHANEPQPLKTGPYCFWCSAKGACPEYRQSTLGPVEAFADVDGQVVTPYTSADAIDDEDLGRALDALAGIEKWGARWSASPTCQPRTAPQRTQSCSRPKL